MKKAILYIDSMQKGGAQRVMSVLGTHLCNKGIETILVNDIVPVNGIEEYQIDQRIRRIFLDQEGVLLSNKNIKRVRKLRKIVKEEKPDVVLSFMGPPNYRMLVATLGLDCRKIVSVRNDPEKEYGSSNLKRIIAGVLFSLADGCVFQTKMASEYFPRFIREKGSIIFNPVDIAFFDEQWEEQEYCLISVGRLYEQKNQALLIRAFAKAHDVIPDIKLKICGKGIEELNLSRLVKKLGLEKNIKFMGEITNVKEELKHSSCFVLSSDYEGLPNALMEAMAVGMPVISTDCPCGGPRMLITDQKNGVLVPCNDEEALSRAVLEIMSNRDRRLQLGMQAKESAERFKTDKIMDKWYNYLFLGR